MEAFKLTNCELNGQRLTKVVRERLAVVRGAGSDTRPGAQEGVGVAWALPPRTGRLVQTDVVGGRPTPIFCAYPHLLGPGPV